MSEKKKYSKDLPELIELEDFGYIILNTDRKDKALRLLHKVQTEELELDEDELFNENDLSYIQSVYVKYDDEGAIFRWGKGARCKECKSLKEFDSVHEAFVVNVY